MNSDIKGQTASIPRSVPLPDRMRTYDISYRFIRPEEFASRGIDPQDVPVGTFVAEDHPPFLASRFGGNAYGFGIVEHRDKLAPAEIDFLEQVDFSDLDNLKKHFRRINGIYRQLGLLIRFSSQGKRYFLIPINWVSHSLEDIRDKVDEIGRVPIKHIYARKKEKLSVGLLTAPNDLIVHEITGRMPSHRYVIIDSMEKLRETRGPLDLMVIPKDIGELLLSLDIPALAGRTLSQESYVTYGTYVAGKIYDILGPGALLLVVASKPFPRTAQEVWVEFLSHDDLRSFLLFSHAFRCKKRYRGKTGSLQRVHLADFYNYLSGIFVYREDLKRLAGDRDPSQLSVEEIDQSPHLDLHISGPGRTDLESQWDKVVSPFFEKITGNSKATPSLTENWQRNYIIETELPDNLQVYVGVKREPPVLMEELEQEERASGMAGSSLALVAAYKNTFDYLLSVLEILGEIRDRRFHRLSELDLNRLHDPFAAPRHRYRTFHHMKQLMKQTGRLRRLEALLNPGGIDGPTTKVLEHMEKLGLLALPPALLREIYLIVVGHSTMGRIAVGKFPEKTLKSITDQARQQSLEEVVDLLRTIRLMSVAETAASLGEHLTREQAREIFTLYDRAIRVAADAHLDWDTLHDQQIAALGGAQNLAVRQMLKMFNLFPFLDGWTELTDKGPFQKEALANYSEETLEQIDQVLGLIRITNEFKERFYGREAFGRTYFFRKLLGCQFHGTGHLFPLLGTRAGFVLLWIVGNASPGNVINFNPLAGYDGQEGDARPVRVRAALETLDVGTLDFDYLNGIRRALAQGKAAFIFNSGIQLRHNPVNQATEVTFIDVPGNLKRLGGILDSARRRTIYDIPTADLREVDRLFRELTSYHEHLQDAASAHGMGGESVAKLSAEISQICARLAQFFAGLLFVPQHLYDNLEILHEHCPTIGRHLLPDFWELYRVKPIQETADGETISAYVLRCVKKFQALVNKEREGLQDVELFYHLAREQFGPMAGESIGASNAQIEVLEGIVERIASRPGLLKALGVALVFQEIGKLCLYLEEYRNLSARVAHGEAGAEMLRRQGLIRRLGMDEETNELAEFLVEVHGLIGHVLRGETALTTLAKVTGRKDELLFDAFFLHSVLAAAAYREGTLVEDLLDRFLQLRQVARRVMGGEMTWDSYTRALFMEKGRALLAETDETPGKKSPAALLPEWRRVRGEEGSKARGQGTAAIERVFRLIGLANINFADVHMKILGMPVTFIYHKKGMKSTGLQDFERDLRKAADAYEVLARLDAELRRALLEKLNPGSDVVRFYGFEQVSRRLEPGNWLKLLILAIRAVDRYRAGSGSTWAVDFQRLAAAIGWRHKAITEELDNLQAERLFRDSRLLARLTRSPVGLTLRCDPKERVVTLLFRDRLGVDRILERLRRSERIGDLRKEYERQIERLQQSPYRTEDYQQELGEVLQSRLQQLLEGAIERAEEKMLRQKDFGTLEKIFHELLTLVEEHSAQEEQMQLVRDLYEFNRDRLRNQRLNDLTRKVRACASRHKLRALWDETRLELINNRRHLGPEFESAVTRHFDEQLARLAGV